MGKILDVEGITGLSDSEAARRLKEEGYNELPSQKKQSFIAVLLRILREPMLLLLLGAGLIYSFVGEVNDALMLLFFVFIVFLFAFHAGRGELEARTLTFATLVIANLMLIAANLSWEKSIIRTINSENRALWLVIGGALLSLVLVLYVPELRELFHFSVLHLDDVLIALVAGVLSVGWIKVVKVRLK